MHLRGGDDGTLYHHLTPTCRGLRKWRESGEKMDGDEGEREDSEGKETYGPTEEEEVGMEEGKAN